MSNITDILGRPFTPPEPKQPDPPETQLLDAIADAGMTPPESVIFDGKMHRFSSDGRPRDDSGWYIAFHGTVPAGAFGCWRLGLSQHFRADIGRDLTPAESMTLAQRMADAKRLRDAEQAKRRESAADTAQAIWDAATMADDAHPYLVAKQIANPGLRVTGDGRLIAPLYGPDGDLVSLQFIAADGSKKYLPGGKAGGSSWHLTGSGTVVYVCEGVATAASIFEATGCTVIIAYSAGNLTAAARTATGYGKPVIIVADNDPSGTGLREAERAAAETGARVVMPPSGDANDYVNAGGDLAALLAPPPPQPGYLIPADDFAGQPAPIRWIVKRWIQRDALHMIHGPSGAGKTFVVLDMILTAAAGIETWFGQRTSQACVVYLAGEGHAGLRARIAGWKLAHEADHLDAWVSSSGEDLDTTEGLSRVQEAIRALPDTPGIIVVDTLHRFMAGDENSAQDARAMLDSCAAIQREFRSAVILIHHTGVSDEAQHRARGSSAWRGALDIEISIIPGTDEKPLEIVQRKSKDAELTKPAFAELSSITLPWLDEDGEPVTTAYVKQADAPLEVKKSKGEEAAIKRLESAAIQKGSRLEDGKTFLSAADWREAYSEGHGQFDGKKLGKEAATKAVQRDKHTLMSAGLISEYQDGYIVSPSILPDISAILENDNKKQRLTP